MVGEVGVGVAAFHNSGEVAGVGLAIGLGCGCDMLGRFYDWDCGDGVVGESNFGAGFRVGADCLNSEAVSEQRMVTDLVDACGCEL